MSSSTLSFKEQSDARLLVEGLKRTNTVIARMQKLQEDPKTQSRDIVVFCRLPRVCIMDVEANEDIIELFIRFDLEHPGYLTRTPFVQYVFALLDKGSHY